MGAGAGALKDESSVSDGSLQENPLKCRLSPEEIQRYTDTSHLSHQEVTALFLYFDEIIQTKRDDGLIDRSEFQSALGFCVNESFYVDRMFVLFDTNNDGFISFEEFLRSVSILSSKGKQDEKTKRKLIRFNVSIVRTNAHLLSKVSFDILDINADEFIDPTELKQMTQANLTENNIVMSEEQVDALVAKTIDEADLNQDGRIDIQEYR